MIASPCAAFVLAGGHSSRMGADKALVELAGEPLLVRALAILRDAGFQPAIAGARSALGGFAPVIADNGSGPLAGVCAALATTASSHAVFLAVDQPFVPPSLVRTLLQEGRITGAAAVLPSSAGFVESFPVALHRDLLPLLLAALQGSDRGCYRAFVRTARELKRPLRILPVELLAQAGHVVDRRGLPASLWCASLNTSADLASAERRLALRGRAIA